MSIVAPLAVFGLLIFFHELGHFVMAKRAGIAVLELSFGVGPRLLSTVRGETRYSLRVLPFLGSVTMASAQLEDGPPVAPDRTFESKPVRARAAVIAAGPAMNLLLCFILLVVVFGAVGIEQPNFDSTVLGQVIAGGPAEAAGLAAGDRVLSIDGQAVADWPSMVRTVQGALGRTIAVTYERGGQVLRAYPVPQAHPQNPAIGFLGIASSVRQVRLPLPLALRHAATETGRMLTLWVGALAGIFRGQGAPDVSGPVGIVQMLGEATRYGLANLLFLAAVMSANLGLINLFPIPALDGSRLVFLGIEAVRGKAVSPEHEGRVHLVGYALLMALLVFLTYRDLLRWGGGPR